ncbi:bacterio-opsin activator domain-containing protein [Haloplanus aerogenes]|uniref:PAS domain S-box-containing protein n=1 Tax=Haloplanus aerogenes TaxID=660522 RepID=A0A3M0DR98_9EURY|nr:bacterio-opsin activator domain-containing protein [Haloplanus aerogenes]AZH24289.1 PAS domain-containing protein [Haloplanus aerogenes]RMB24077.1 PAS domain S-box-containing protein [Haloplanus aerogenes]
MSGRPEEDGSGAEAVPQPGDRDGVTAVSTDAVDESLKTRTMDEAPVGITIADATEPDLPLVYANAAFERITGYPPAYAVGRNCRFLQGEQTRDEPVARMRDAIEEGEATTVELRNYRRDGEQFWNEVTIAPLRDGEGRVAYYVGFQQDVTRRKRAERAAARRAAGIERERAAQELLLERLDGVVADATAAVAEARSRDDLEEGVVEGLAATYTGAWLGSYEPADETMHRRADAGWTPDDRERIGVGDDDTVGAAVSRAVADGRVTIRALADGTVPATAVAAIPLHYGDATYGAVCVYARSNSEFDDHERAVLTALGRTVATGINTLESQRTLRGAEVVELQFTVMNHPLVTLAESLGCRLAYAGSVADRDRPTSLFELSDATGEAVRDAAASTAVEVHGILVDERQACLVELSVEDEQLRALLADHGAQLRDVTVADGVARVTVEVARESLARSLTDAVIERFDGADLVGYRQCERREETREEFVTRLHEELTDRQHAALVRAYSGGFFEWPHETTGDELADAMGVCRSTFHEHLRAAQRKLVGAVLDA